MNINRWSACNTAFYFLLLLVSLFLFVMMHSKTSFLFARNSDLKPKHETGVEQDEEQEAGQGQEEEQEHDETVEEVAIRTVCNELERPVGKRLKKKKNKTNGKKNKLYSRVAQAEVDGSQCMRDVSECAGTGVGGVGEMGEGEKETMKTRKCDVMTVGERANLLNTVRLTRAPSPGMIVIDNFYTNAMEMREMALRQEFKVRGNYPGVRTRSFASVAIRNKFQEFVAPFGGRITVFPVPKADGSDADQIYNGSFQVTTSRDRSWVHTDHMNNWAALIYLTPNAPLSSGTGFFEYCDGTRNVKDVELLENRHLTDESSQDMTKWALTDMVGNVFNRLVLFNATNFHMSMDYFGTTMTDGRLFQVFFFSTEG